MSGPFRERTCAAPSSLPRGFDRIADWASSVEKSWPDADAPATAGAPIAGRVCRSPIPGFARVRERIVAYDEPGMDLAYELVDPPRFLARARSHWRIASIDERRSRVIWEGTVEPRGLTGRLATPALRLGLSGLAARTVGDLRSHLESGPRAPKRSVRMKTLEFSRAIDAPAAVAWRVVSDLAGFGDAAPNLSRAEVFEGEGEGMLRRCYEGSGRGWDEVCMLWQEGRRYQMRVRTETYPFPLRQLFREFSGAWEVEPQGASTLVSMRYQVEPSALGRALWAPIHRVFSRRCELLLDNWQREIETLAASSAAA